MKLTSLLLSYCMIFCGVSLKSQTNLDLPKVLPASPTATALGTYATIPISLYTGLPDISVPIWDLKGREISMAISLSYRASGVKVEENATWVGLGWSLNAGGVITRSVNGNPDFGHGISGRATLPLPTMPLVKLDSLTKFSVIDGVLDLEPDVFYYNFNGKSGSFVFDQQGNARFNQFDDIKVKYTADIEYVPGIGTYGQFEMTTSDGTVYLFKDREISSMNSNPSSWYLTQITSPSGKEIFNLVYDREDYSYQNAIRDEVFLNDAQTNFVVGDNTPIIIIGKRLKEINTNTIGKIVFKPAEQKRKDFSRYMYDTYALEDIKIYNSQNKQIRKFKLETENVETSLKIDPGNLIYQDSEYLNWRMYLKGVTEYDSSGTVCKAPYMFQYHDRDNNGKDKLPHRASFAQDHWGYYNGEDDNFSLIPSYFGKFGEIDPQFDVFEPICPAPGTISIENFSFSAQTGNRNPSFPSMRSGTLKAIIYPTGGHAEFEYEPHQGTYINSPVDISYIGIVGGLRVKSITSFDNCNNILGKKEYEYENGGLVSFPKYRSYEYDNPNDVILRQVCDVDNNVPDGSLVLHIKSNSFTQMESTKGSTIGYGKVYEKESGNGSTIYNYTSPFDLFYGDENSELTWFIFKDTFIPNRLEEISLHKANHFTWPYNPSKNHDWKRGILTRKTILDQYGKNIRNEEYDYGLQILGTVPGLRLKEVKEGLEYFHSQYSVPYGWSYLKKKTITDAGGVTEVTEIEYEPLFKYQNKVTIHSSKNETQTTTYKYPFNYTEAPYTSMVSRHIVSPVIEMKTFKGVTGLSTLTTGYRDWFNDQKVFAPETIQTKQEPDGQTEIRLRYHALNENGNVLSVSKEGGSKVSYLWDYNAVYPIAEAKNATNEEIAYTSFETEGHGNWSFIGGIVQDLNAQTGEASYTLNGTNTISKAGLSPSKNYIVSYWSRNGAYNVNNAPANSGVSTNGWTYFEHELSGINSVSIQGSGSIDELRLHPKEAIMSTYTFKPSVGITSSSDNRNVISYFNYDRLGRLETLKDYKGNVIKKLDYHYSLASQNDCNQTVYYNVEKSHDFIKDGCGPGSAAITYKVSAKTFSSLISQADADQKAQSIVDTYGQTSVNNTGICKYYNDEISGNYTAVGCGAGYEGHSVYVNVPANKFSGYSKANANEQATHYAQTYANQHGCLPGSVNVTVANPYDIRNFKAKFVNDITHAIYEFDMDYGGVVGQVPSGSYSITIYNPFSASTTYTFGAAEYSLTGTSATFISVNIVSTEVVVSINY